MTFGGSQVAQSNERLPLTKVLLNVGGLAKELVRLDDEREEAEWAREKARAEVDGLKKHDRRDKDRAEEGRRRMDHNEHKIRRLTRALKKIEPILFEATNEEEMNEAQKLPQKLDEIFKKVTGARMAAKFRVESTFNASDKKGDIKIQWKGNP
jgi:chromosome segregation ATPase